MSGSTETSVPRRIALVAVALLVVFAGCAGAGGGEGDAGAPPSDGGSAVDGGSGGGGGQSGGGEARSVGSYYDDDGNRVVVREAEMRLRVDDFESAFAEIQTVVRERGGYLGDRSQRGAGEWDAGEIVLRVPATEFSAVRDRLADLGRVERENVDVKDFTDQHRDRAERLEQLRADERRLERVLNRTDDPENATRVRSELEEVRSEIRNLESEQSSLTRRATMSTITLRMHEPEDRKPPDNYVSVTGFASAFTNAVYGGLALLEATVAFIGYMIPITLSVLLVGAFFGGVYLIGRPLVRRPLDYLRERKAADDGSEGARRGLPGDESRSRRRSPADDEPRDGDLGSVIEGDGSPADESGTDRDESAGDGNGGDASDGEDWPPNGGGEDAGDGDPT